MWVCCDVYKVCSPVNELINEDDVPWSDVFSQRATGRGDQDVSTLLLLQSPDICTIIHVRWHDGVFPAMPSHRQRHTHKMFHVFTIQVVNTNVCVLPGEQHTLYVPDLAQNQRIRWLLHKPCFI